MTLRCHVSGLHIIELQLLRHWSGGVRFGAPERAQRGLQWPDRGLQALRGDMAGFKRAMALSDRAVALFHRAIEAFHRALL